MGRDEGAGGAATAPDRARIEACLLELVRGRGPGKTICPSEVARALAGPDEKAWRRLMRPVRAAAVDLAERGRVAVTRKGRVVDPAAFKGVYRIGLVSDAEETGTGS